MAKAKLTAAAKAWVKKPAARAKARAADSGKQKMTIYIARRASKLLWKRRVDAGVPISRTIEDLIIKNLG